MNNITYTSKIHSLTFYVQGTEENQIDSNVIINTKDMFKNDKPLAGGIYDAHMGTTDHSWLCETCGNNKILCPGHPGSIVLNYPVKNPLFREYILKWLKIICFKCGNLIINKDLKIQNADKLTTYIKLCKSITTCPICKEYKYNIIKDKFEQSTFYIENDKKRFELFNHEIKNILNKISDETVLKVGKPVRSHPKNFILSVIRVPSNVIRPDVRKIGGFKTNNDEITAFLKNIIEINDLLPPIVPDKAKIHKELREIYFNLDMTYHEMIKGNSGSNNQVRLLTNTNKTPNSMASRISGKKKLIRGNLMGKRVRYMIRSVITGDNMIKLDEVGIPIDIARSLQIPETVRSYNINRLNIYYKNSTLTYPGCAMVIKNSNKQKYKIQKLLENSYELQYGDVVYRDMISGDTIGFNRQPSLTFTSISSHKVIVVEKCNSLCMNVAVCKLYNADFDGDNMHVIVLQDIQSINELGILTSPDNWMISYQTISPKMGTYQDSLIGMAEFTKSTNFLNKYHAMRMFSQVENYNSDIAFNKKEYIGRELLELFMPKINLSNRKAKIFLEAYTPYIKYDKNDINVLIQRGKLISGVLDAATMGIDVNNSIFQIINNDYNSKIAMETIYSMQQISTAYFYYAGFTIGINDITISDKATDKINEKIKKTLLDYNNVTDKLNKGDLIPPIGMTTMEYYELEQMNILEPGDDFIEPIFDDTDFNNNKLARLIYTGSRGKSANFTAINGAIGSHKINGARMLRNFSYGRTAPYYLRFEMDPISLGYATKSFREGLTSDMFIFAAAEARDGFINMKLSTSVAGYQNRLSIKNLESIIIDNLYRSVKDQNIIQFLYSDTGIDTRKLEKVKILTALTSGDEFKKYHTKLSNVDKIYRNKNVENILDEEFQTLTDDRNKYREIFMSIENGQLGNYICGDTHLLPINLFRIIENVIYNYTDIYDKLDKNQKILDPVYAINKVKELCIKMPYLYFNNEQEKRMMEIPEYIKCATTLVNIFIRSYLSTYYLYNKGVNNIILDIIIEKIIITFKTSLVNYGKSVGIIAAQSVCEPLTQYVLNAKHRAGVSGGSKTGTIQRFKQIIGAKDTTDKDSTMLIVPLPEYIDNKNKVQEIANHIEMIKFDRFVDGVYVFFEKFGNPVHSKYKHEKKMISDFLKYNNGIKVPNNLTNWCIRYSINKEQIIINNIKIENIILKLQLLFPEIFVVYTPINLDDIVIRIYTTITNELDDIIQLSETISNSIIRGIDNIISTEVISVLQSYVDEDLSIKNKKIYAIHTQGTNLEEVLNNPYVDKLKTHTDSIIEYFNMYGVAATREKIIIEMVKTLEGVSKEHVSIYADEMLYSGIVTSIHKSGLQKREMSNVTLRLSFQSPIQTLEDACINGLVNNITGISGPLILGASPCIGTSYNKIIINEQFIDDDINTYDDADL